jgi:biotin operon repressor
MVTYGFEIDDVAAIRFAISPLHELVNSLRTFRDRPTATMHVPWLRRISGRIDGAALRPMIALVVPRGYTPDFLTPPPAKPNATIGEELDVLAATPADQVVHDIRNAQAQMHHDAAIVEPWLREPPVALARAVDVLRQYWEDALAGVWQHIHGLLAADIAYRAAQLADGGLGATVSDLHETARWDGHHLVVDTLRTETCELAGRGLLLMPSAFASIRASAITRAPWQPTVVYPARGVSTLWEPPAQPSSRDALARVIGDARARLLAELDVPRSSTDLGKRTGLSAASVSEHLAALRDAGLVSSRRSGRYVLQARTLRAEQLLSSE